MLKYTKFQEVMQDIKNAKPIDLRIDNAQIADVFSGNFFSGSLCVHKGLIVGFSKTMQAEHVIDAKKAWLLPTFFDAHVHILPCSARKNLQNWLFLSAREQSLPIPTK